LSDVSLGYGSPQIPSLAESLGRLYDAHVLILEKDEAHRPPYRPDFLSDNVMVERLFIPLKFHRYSYFAAYASQAIFYIKMFKPDILVSTIMEPLLFLGSAGKTSKVNILYYLEYGITALTYKAIHNFSGRIDYIIFPEENRARLEMPRLRLSNSGTKKVVMHNSRMFKTAPEVKRPHDRNGRFIYAGGLWERTKTQWLLDEKCRMFPIDIFGGGGQENLFREKVPNYYGYLPTNDNFFDILSCYTYSLVLWSPDYDDTYYCAPNKLYDALACGVPFISGPHPLCVTLVSKYNCGLILDDWSIESLVKTLSKAKSIYMSQHYELLVQGCYNAMREECDWDIQFDKLASMLPSSQELTKIKQKRRKRR
jgi:glycosyltransferase involved in cell wall biosynthesis